MFRAKAFSCFLVLFLAVGLLPVASSVATSPQSTSVENAYIKIVAGDGGPIVNGTTGGDPDVAGDENKALLFGFPAPGASTTGFPTVRIAGSSSTVDYKLGQDTPNSGPTLDGDTITTVWIKSGINVRQETSLSHNPYTGRPDTTRIAYTITNNNSQSKDVGIRLMLDVKVGASDNAPYFVPGTGNTSKEQSYTSSNMPPYFKTFESLTYDENSLKGMGILDGFGATTPDRFVIASWLSINATSWDYTITSGAETGDSAVAWWWDPVTLAAGASRTYVTYYGLGATGGGTDWIDAPAVVNCDERDLHADLWIVNDTGSAYQNGQAFLDLPEGLLLADGEQMSKQMGNVAASGGVGSAGWDLRATGTVSGTVTFTATTTFDSKVIVTEREITVPACLEILQPVEGAELVAGPPDSPDRQILVVTNKPATGLTAADVRVWVGTKEATVVSLAETSDTYRILIAPPAQTMSAIYDLKVELDTGSTVAFGGWGKLMAEVAKAIRFALNPPTSWSLVLDHSGSMRERCPGPKRVRKFDHVAVAARDITRHIYTLFPDHKLGVVQFRSGGLFIPIVNPIVELAPLNENWLLLLTHKDHALLDLFGFQQKIPRGQTPIWYGVGEGLDMLKNAGTDSKQMLFLSDGNPVPKNQWGDVKNRVKEAAKKGIVIHSLGFSIDKDQNQKMLKMIAGQGTGRNKVGLRGNYIKMDEICKDPIVSGLLKTVATVAGRKIQFKWTNQPAQSSVTSATQDEVTIRIGSCSEAEFFVTWLDPDANLSLTLKTPGGKTITPSTAENDPDITYSSGDTYAYYLTDQPQWGVWTAIVSGADGEPYWLQSSGRAPEGEMPMVLEPQVGGGGYGGGATTDKPLAVRVFLVDEGPIGGTVTARVTRPDGSQVNLTLYDDGGHGDGAAGDGLYGNTLAAPLQPGSYDMVFEASGTDGGTPFERAGTDSIQVVPPLYLDGDPVALTVGSNQEFDISLYYENASDEPMYDVSLKATYDSHVTYVSADPPPDSGNNTWNLGALAPGEYGFIDVTLKTKPGLAGDTKLTTEVELSSGGAPVDTIDVDLTVAGAPATLEVGAGPSTLEADGEEFAEIWAEILDGNGNPTASGLEVTFETNLGDFEGKTTTKETSEEGIALVPLTSNRAGEATVTVSVGGLTAQTKVTFTGNQYVHLPLVMRNYGSGKLFFDDFGDPKTGWQETETSKGSVGYSQDEYVIRPKVDHWFIWATAPGVACADCTIQVDAWRSTGDNSLYGIVFGLDESVPEFYAFGIQPYTKNYYVKRYGRDGWVTLIDYTSSSHINYDKAENRLKVTRDGSKAKLYVNDHYLTTLNNSKYMGVRQVGIFGRSTTESPVWLRFDDFTVWSTGYESMAAGLGDGASYGAVPAPPDFSED